MASSKVPRLVGCIAAALSMCLLLTSCINASAKLAITAEGRASGQYELRMDKSFASLVGVVDLASFKALVLKEDQNAVAASPKDITFGETSTSYSVRVWVRNQALTDKDLNVGYLPDGRLKLVFRNEGSDDWTADQANDFTFGQYNVSLSWGDGLTPVEWSKEFLLNHSSMDLRIPIRQPVPEAFVIFNVPKKLRGGKFTRCYKGEKTLILKGKNKSCPRGYEN